MHLSGRRDDLQGLRLHRRLQTSSALLVGRRWVQRCMQGHGHSPVYADGRVEDAEQVFERNRTLQAHRYENSTLVILVIILG